MTDSLSPERTLKKLLYDDPDAADRARFGFESQAEYRPITMDIAREVLNRNKLIVPTQWWEATEFLDEVSTRSERWNTEARFGGEQVNLGEGPQALIDTVYFISDGNFSRATLKDIVETANMDAIEVTIEEVDDSEVLRLWWDE